jgi:hypothetical protein
MQFGGAKCSLCGSEGTNKSTCPWNPNANNKNKVTHPLATGPAPTGQRASVPAKAVTVKAVSVKPVPAKAVSVKPVKPVTVPSVKPMKPVIPEMPERPAFNYHGLWKPMPKPLEEMTRAELLNDLRMFTKSWESLTGRGQDASGIQDMSIKELRGRAKWYYSEGAKNSAEDLLLNKDDNWDYLGTPNKKRLHALRHTNKDYSAEEEEAHDTYVNDTDLPIKHAKLHFGINLLMGQIAPNMKHKSEVYDELNNILNQYLIDMAREMVEGSGLLKSAVLNMFKSSTEANKIIKEIEKSHSRALATGLVVYTNGLPTQVSSIDDVPYSHFTKINGNQYPVPDINRTIEMDIKEVKRVLVSYHDFSDSDIMLLSAALNTLAAEIIIIGTERSPFLTREHVREAENILFSRK